MKLLTSASGNSITQFELTSMINNMKPSDFGFDAKGASSQKSALITLTGFMNYHDGSKYLTCWASIDTVSERSGVTRKTIINVYKYLADMSMLVITKKKGKYKEYLHNHYTWLGFRQPAIMFSEWLALKKAKTPYVKPEPVMTKTLPEPLQQAPRPCEIKPSESTFEEDMLATELLVKPESVSCGVREVSMEDFIDGNVDLSYSDFLKHYAKIGLDANMLTDKARELYREHIREESEDIPF